MYEKKIIIKIKKKSKKSRKIQKNEKKKSRKKTYGLPSRFLLCFCYFVFSLSWVESWLSNAALYMYLIMIINLPPVKYPLFQQNRVYHIPTPHVTTFEKPSLIVYLRCLRLVEEFWSSPKPMVIYLLWQVVRDNFHFHLWDIYIYDTWEMRVSKHYLWGASIWFPCLLLLS